MKKKVFLVFVLVSSVFSLGVEEIVKNALQNNQELQSLSRSIDIFDEQIKISTNWKNPSLFFGVNDIQFKKPIKRDIERMQTQFIGVSQVIPLGDKLELKHNILNKKKDIATLLLEDKKAQLKSKIYQYSHSLIILEKKHELLVSYQKNIKSLEELSDALYENGKLSQTDLIGIKIAYSKVELKKVKIHREIDDLYLMLKEISFIDISSIEITQEMKEKVLSVNFEKHPQILAIENKIQIHNEIAKLEIAKKSSDLKLSLSYANRKSFKDYINISASIPLSFKNTENVKSFKAKLEAKKEEKKLNDLKQKFKITVERLQHNMNSSLKSYKIIKNTIIPLKKEMGENIELHNSYNHTKPQNTITNLNELISYEMMLLDEMKSYFIALSKSIYITQGKI